MRKRLIFALPAIMLVAACGETGTGSAAGVEVPSVVEAGNVRIEMVNVPPCSFAMGYAPNGSKVRGASLRQVVLSGYSISKLPVSQELWAEIMSDKPSSSDSPSAPVDMVSYKDCNKFISKLSRKTGIPFSIPTEAQWEYAVSNGFAETPEKYSEWCADSYIEEIPSVLYADPFMKKDGASKVLRTKRQLSSEADYMKMPLVTFHLAVNTMVPLTDEIRRAFIDREFDREHVSAGETVDVDGLKIKMIGVEGGTFEMGATPDQAKYASDDEKPVHSVTVSGFEIAESEVTAGLWLKVMGKLPFGNSPEELSKPVVNVSWYDCQSFILKLNALTGRKFRLPTEAEWEFAARGGVKSRNTPVAGGRFAYELGAFVENAASKIQPVKSYRPNELGIYDMCGNAWEWCQDCYGAYGEDEVSDPCRNDDPKYMVMRGGSAASRWSACRVANRSAIPPCTVKGTFGLRLAL